MLKKALRSLKQWLHLRKRRRKILAKEKEMGGMRVRVVHRLKRRMKIKKEKSMVIEDLHRSWKIGEIKPAVFDDLMTLDFHRERISWAELIRIKKRYWHENI
jgi:hypothetical protein